jgi:hypothetical protein
VDRSVALPSRFCTRKKWEGDRVAAIGRGAEKRLSNARQSDAISEPAIAAMFVEDKLGHHRKD